LLAINVAARVAGIRLGNVLEGAGTKIQPAPMPTAPSVARPIAPVQLTVPKLREGPVTPPPVVARPIAIPTTTSKTGTTVTRKRIGGFLEGV